MSGGKTPIKCVASCNAKGKFTELGDPSSFYALHYCGIVISTILKRSPAILVSFATRQSATAYDVPLGKGWPNSVHLASLLSFSF